MVYYGYSYYYVYLKYAAFAVLAASLPVIALVVLKLFQKLSVGRCRSMVCLIGKTVVVTGGCTGKIALRKAVGWVGCNHIGGQARKIMINLHTGLGFQTAIVLASRGARVILADKVDGAKAKKKIIDKTHNTNIVTKYLDLASLVSVRKFAKDINATEERLDILINNAGVGSVGNKYTDDGLHPTMQVNHLAPFLLTHLLTDLLKKSAPSRIIFVSSASAFITNLTVDNVNYPTGHPMSLYRTTMIYGNSKLCNVIAANGFAERLKDSGVTSNSLHPGMVNTDIFLKTSSFLQVKSFAKLLMNIVLLAYGKSAEEGAQTIIHLALCNKLNEVTGKHFWDCRLFPSPPGTWNKKFADSIWEKSEELVGLKPEEKLKLE